MAAAAAGAGRAANDVCLLAVSKTFTSEAIRDAYHAGQKCFAESYAQEALEKIAALHDLPIEWHYIGPLQSNKTRSVAAHFAWVHSVDRLKIAERLSEQRPAHLPPLQLCLQVNVSGEASKSGVSPHELTALAHAIARLPNLQLRGLMAVPAPSADVATQRLAFAQLRELRDQLNRQGLQLDTLSMGMSDDFAAAIAEGSTMVRIGSAIFGNRIYQKCLIFTGKTDMNICFIGGGNMATALIGGLLGKGIAAQQISVVEISADSRVRLEHDFSVRTFESIADGMAGSQIIVLAVKPQQLQEVAQQLAPLLNGQLLISIAAGIRAADLARWSGNQAVVRVMPNTPALIQSGMTGMYALPAVSAAQREQAQNILAAVGETLWLQEEAMLDAVTAISGSGPAYVFYFIEALQQAARELGFNAEDARRLSLATFLGASKLAASSNEDASVLRARVTSKNGTTERALLSMIATEVAEHIAQAAYAAAVRAREMGDELGSPAPGNQ
jgi:pyrroline-5-carboxylate reductase